MKIGEFINGAVVYREMTSDEIERMERERAEMPEPMPTLEEQLADLTDLVAVLSEVICGD